MEQDKKQNTEATEATPDGPNEERSGVNNSRRNFATAGLAALGAAALAGTVGAKEAAAETRKNKILTRIKSNLRQDEVTAPLTYGKVGGYYEK
jgi:hypothetical protein